MRDGADWPLVLIKTSRLMRGFTRVAGLEIKAISGYSINWPSLCQQRQLICITRNLMKLTLPRIQSTWFLQIAHHFHGNHLIAGSPECSNSERMNSAGRRITWIVVAEGGRMTSAVIDGAHSDELAINSIALIAWWARAALTWSLQRSANRWKHKMMKQSLNPTVFVLCQRNLPQSKALWTLYTSTF